MKEAPRHTVLLIDDDPDNRRLFTLALANEDCEIIEAKDGSQGIDLAIQSLPHVIVMDRMMPVLDGIQATRILRQDPRTELIPILMASAGSQSEDMDAGLAAGADDYVTKPIRPEQFRLRIRSMIRMRQAQLTLERTNSTLQRRNYALATLNMFSKDLLGETTPESVLRLTTERAADLLRCRRAMISLPDQTEERLVVGHAVGIEPRTWRGKSIPMEDTFEGQVFRNQESLIINEDSSVADCIPTSGSACIFHPPLISVPLMTSGATLGVLTLSNQGGVHPYGLEDEEILSQLTQAAATALATLYAREELDATRDAIILALAKLSEFRHHETARHLERVTAISVLLAEQLITNPRFATLVDDTFIENLRRGAPLHDIGKIAIPDSILCKPDKLSSEEYRIMHTHTRIGAEIMRTVSTQKCDTSFISVSAQVAEYHHECYDGSGYPDGLGGDDIPLSARIVCIADTYDAIRSEREYKQAQSHENALSEIRRCAGSQFDPILSRHFCAAEEQVEEIHDHFKELESIEESPLMHLLASSLPV